MNIKIEIEDQKTIEVLQHGENHVKIKIGEEEVLVDWRQRNHVANMLFQSINMPKN